MSDDITVVYRQGTKEDVPFIYNSYVQSNKTFGPNAYMQFSQYKSGRTALFNRLVESATITVACASDDSSHIFGYGITTGTIINWVYVKAAYRRKGIGLGMLKRVGIDPKEGVLCTDVSYACKHLKKEFNIILIQGVI